MAIDLSSTSYGSRDARRAAEREHAEARAKATSRYTIAPRSWLDVKRGRLNAGDEILLTDLVNEHPHFGPIALMERLVDCGRVIMATDEDLAAARCPADAEFRVGPKTILAKGRHLVPGAQITEADLDGGRKQLLALAASGRVLARDYSLSDTDGPTAA